MSSPVTVTTTIIINYNYNCYPTATRFVNNNKIDYNSLYTFSTETEPLALGSKDLHEFHPDHRYYWQHPFTDLLDQQRARALPQDGAALFDPTSARGRVADAAQFRRQLSELQPTLTIGALGHVSHGKSTLVGRLTNVKTARHSKEQARNMTIKLGYANAKIYRCDDGECPKPACYTSMASNTKGKPRCHCGSTMTLARHVSFVDCPGHEMLMSVMLNAASAMDAAVLVVAANEECPRPQTAEHLAAADLMNLGRYVVIQNKVDLVSEENARKSYLDIRGFTQGTGAERSPVIPISAQLGYNVDVVCQYIAEQVPEPEHDLSLPPLLNVIRSFDVNKPGAPFEELKGAVMGGVLESGLLQIGQRIEIRPGLIRTKEDGSRYYQPLYSRVVSLLSDTNPLTHAIPGGLIGVGTLLDPSLGKNDGLVGQVVGAEGSLPEVFQEVEVKYRLFRRLIGTAEGEKVEEMKTKENVLLHVGGNSAVGVVTAVKAKTHRLVIKLTHMPICAREDQRVAFSRHAGKDHWRLVGFGRLTRNCRRMPRAAAADPLLDPLPSTAL